MIRFSTFLVFVIAVASAKDALAHGFQITIDQNNALQIATEDPTAGIDPVLGPRMIYKVQTLFGSADDRSTDHPGYEATSGFATGDSISFDVLSELWYSPGSGTPVPTPAGVGLTISRVDLGPGTATVTGSTGFQSGFLIGTYDGSALSAYEHELFYELTDTPSVPVGAYAVALQLRGTDASSVPFTPSAPLVAVFDNGLDLTTFDSAAEQLYAAAVPEPSGLLLAAAGLGGLLFCGLRARRRGRQSSP